MIRIAWIKGRVLGLITLATSVSLAPCGAARPDSTRPLPAPTKADVQLSANEDKFKCDKNNSKVQASDHASNKYSVSLSWKPSVSFPTPPVKGDGYNVYRFNPVDRSCTKINKDPIPGTATKDGFVELGQTYQYAARAVKQNRESNPSNVVEVKIPLK